MASKGVNKCIIMGRLGQDPEVRYAASGTAFCNITVATSEEWKDKNTGEKKEETEWHRIVFSGKIAEIAGEYLKKGSQVFVEGKLKTRKWTDQSGQDKYTTEIVVDSFNGVMQMIGSAQQSQGQQQQNGYARQAQQPQSAPPVYNEPPMDWDDNIPF